MVLRENSVSAPHKVKWIGSHDPYERAVQLENKKVYFYKKCIYGALTLTVGDYILVSNADSAEPDTVDGSDIAKILYLYELHEMTEKEISRAIVQWYSRPSALPRKEFNKNDYTIDFNIEIIEEHRPFDNDIALGTIFRKCTVLLGTSKQNIKNIMAQFQSRRQSLPVFICRYKFIKEGMKKSYRLVPLEFIDSANTKETVPRRSTRRSVAQESDKRNSININRRGRSFAASPIEFIDVNQLRSENKVSPIRIVGGRSVVKLSAKNVIDYEKCSEENNNYHNTSPLSERNTKIITPKSRVSTACRNLSLSLDNDAESTADSDCLNYSIVKETPDPKAPSNDMKIKLRVSERRRSPCLTSNDVDPLDVEQKQINDTDVMLQRKRVGTITSIDDIYNTPTKKSRDSADVAGLELTLGNRRKSILKSASTRLADGTPRRSIQLSDIVEKRVFKNDDIILTPKRDRTKRSLTNADSYCTPKKTIQKTPTRKKSYIEDDVEYSSTPKKPAQKTPARRLSTTKHREISTPSGTASMTPSQKLKLIRAGELSPTMEQRSHTMNDNKKARKSELQIAREQLHVSVVPKSLPCRENEFDNIYTFLEGKIQDQCGGCMYVSGVPGTGKTATVTGVIRVLQSEAAAEKLPEFEFLEINGMRLTEPRQAYVQIYKQLTGKTVSWEHAHTLLEKRFTTPAPRRVTTVLLVDELDILCNRRQDVVYNLLDWPTKSTAKLVVITIANTMDLPERLLMGKVTSRLGLTRLTFQPYTHKQLQQIVTARLLGSDAFKVEAVQLVARKVAAVSGDARRALDICRRATEIADNASKDNCVNMQHVQQALGEMIASTKVQAIKNCSHLEQIFLQAVSAEVSRTGVEETTFMGVYNQIESIAAFMGVVIPTPGCALRICSKLGAERLIISEHSRNDLFQKILLNVSADDIHYAMRVNNE